MSQFLLPYCSTPIHTRLSSQGLISQQTLIWKSEHSNTYLYIHGDYRNWLTWSWPRSSMIWHLQAVRRTGKADGLVQSKFRVPESQRRKSHYKYKSLRKGWGRKVQLCKSWYKSEGPRTRNIDIGGHPSSGRELASPSVFLIVLFRP